MTLAKKKQVPRPSDPCLSARTVSPYVIDPMGRDSAWPESYVSWFRGSCRRRAVLGSKQAAPISVSDSSGSSLGTVVVCWVGVSELALPQERSILSRSLGNGMESSSSTILSAVSGFASLGPSSGVPRRRFRLLSFALPPGRFRSLLVRPQVRSRIDEWGLGLPFL